MPNKKKSKNKKNDFYFFMQDQKKVLAREGQNWNTMDDLVALCNPRWKLLPDRERNIYKEMAKDHREKERENLALKFDSSGRNLLSIDIDRKNEEFEHEKMVRHIRNTVSLASDMGTLSQQKFFLIHVNYLCEVGDKQYVPCELALLEFSLRDGIVDAVQTFVRPPEGTIPLGYGYTMQKHAAEAHGITVDDEPMLDEAAGAYATTIDEILKRINPGGIREAVSAVYTLEEDVDVVRCALENLIAWSRRPFHQEFKIYPVHRLWFEMAEALAKNVRFASDLLAKDALNDDVYHFTAGLACHYHDFHDKPRFCSLNCVKRWAYAILERCCESFAIPLVPLTHVHAERSKNNVPLNQTFLVKWRQTNPLDLPERSADVETNMFGAPKTRAMPAGYVAGSKEYFGVNTKKYPDGKLPGSFAESLPWPDLGPVKEALPDCSGQTKSFSWAKKAGQSGIPDSPSEAEFPALSSTRGRGRGRLNNK